jgi:hypothetical protein
VAFYRMVSKDRQRGLVGRLFGVAASTVATSAAATGGARLGAVGSGLL